MALTDEQLELLGNRLVPLYQELEQDVIADIARRVKKTGRYTAVSYTHLTLPTMDAV